MSASTATLPTDQLLLDIADYAAGYAVQSDAAFNAARHCLLDSLACALEALEHPDCVRLLGPVVPGAELKLGARVCRARPGCSIRSRPVSTSPRRCAGWT